MTFKKGDLVRCIDDTNVTKYLTVGTSYVVARDQVVGSNFVYIAGKTAAFFATRFELKDQPVATFKAGDDAIVIRNDSAETPGIRHFIKLGTRVKVVRTAPSGDVSVVVYDKAVDFVDSPRQYGGQTLSRNQLRPVTPKDMPHPSQVPAPTAKSPAPKAAPTARWYVIDSTKNTLVAVGLTNRAAGVEWIKSFGNTSHRYIIAKETGEFVCTRTVAEV